MGKTKDKIAAFNAAMDYIANPPSKKQENMSETYQELDALPAWTRAQWEAKEKLLNEADPFKWSGPDLDPPAIGAKVKTYVNDVGPGTVIKYFVQHGWLGVLVQLDAPPAWYTKQNKGNPPAHLFGIDLEPRKVKAEEDK
jgi:hypothetical protein